MCLQRPQKLLYIAVHRVSYTLEFIIFKVTGQYFLFSSKNKFCYSNSEFHYYMTRTKECRTDLSFEYFAFLI